MKALPTRLTGFGVVVVAYVLAHGLTALLITPLQARLLPEITAYASLIYLPHGVRVLATWLLGRVAVVPLALGAFLSEALFTPAAVSQATDPVILVSILVGALAAPLAFEGLRLAGRTVYAGRSYRVRWQDLLLVGAVASLLNSFGQSAVFSGGIIPGHSLGVLITYALGDISGLIVTTLVLMLLFRWLRMAPARG